MRNRESSSAQDARVEELWRTLDTNERGFLDLKGLKKGLKKLDHRTWMDGSCGSRYHVLTMKSS